MKTLVKTALICALACAGANAAYAAEAAKAAAPETKAAVQEPASPITNAAAVSFREVTFSYSRPLGTIKVGSRVDVIAVFYAPNSDANEKVAATLLQNVMVTAVKDNDVTLFLSPNEAQYLFLALGQGEVNLAVRPDGDNAIKPMEMATFRKLFPTKAVSSQQP